MLTLEQVRVVNDGFKSGDLNAALRPLEETIDLRSNELPRLDKAALAALKTGLQNGDDAATWAQALLHPNISVRRFARKVFMGLGDEAAPLFEPLRQRIERYWSEEKPLGETNKPREAALRREQREMVEGALEILLRSHPEKFLEFYADLMDVTPIGDTSNSHNSQAMREWQERNSEAWQATQKEIERLLTDEWGSEWAQPTKRWKLPSRVLREIDERARQSPEVAALWEKLGESPFERAAPEWQPTQLMTATFGSYLSTYGQTGPMKRVADRLRPGIWGWTYAAFDFGSSTEERSRNARRLMGSNGWWGFAHWLGTERLIVELPSLLMRSKAPLLEQAQSQLGAEQGLYNIASPNGDGWVARLWLLLTWALGNALQRPYNIQPEDWIIPAEVEPETLRQIIAELQTNQSSDHIVRGLKDAAKNIDEARQLQKEKAQSPVEVVETSVVEAEPESARVIAVLPTSLLNPYDVLGDEQIREIYAKDGYTDEAQARISAEVEKVEREMSRVQEPEKKVQLLVQPPAHPRDANKIISRMPYWRVWSRDLGEKGEQKLKEAVWSEAEPKLWARLDATLEEYRRAETDPVEPKIEQKLTERELKEWRAQMRRETRTAIAREIWDVVGLLVHVNGFKARLRAIELADRPSCRDIHSQMELTLIGELERYPGDYGTQSMSGAAWSEWRLGDEWEEVLRRGEAQLEKAKEEWGRANLERQLATGYYWRGQFERFKEMATRPNVSPYGVAMAVVARDDFEAWRVLIGNPQYGLSDQLSLFWKAQLGDPERKRRALESVVSTLATTSENETSRRLLGWVNGVLVTELEPFLAEIENALESALVPVKKWAMSVLGALAGADFDRERAALTAGEALWSENAGLAKDAAKFLSQMAAQEPSVAETAWDALCDATALDNVGVAEAIYRALSQLRTKNKSLELSDAAHEKLGVLVGVQAERFTKFQKKLV
ncbi:hypothetical protein IAD21_05830 [Abditibacteriota bacterium]|nr:hypothetical protein IAD21_05830 [Abditibacteriota bacterium]